MVLLSLLLDAHAADEACFDCCRAGGLSACNASLSVYGDGSRLARDGDAWRVVGLWEVGCNGVGVFDASASVRLSRPPLGGELVMEDVNPLRVHCFEQACALPATTCVSPVDDMGRFFLLDCGSGLPVDGTVLSNVTPVVRNPTSRVVVVDGRPLVVVPVSGNAFAPGTTNGAVAPARSGAAPPRIAPVDTSPYTYTPSPGLVASSAPAYTAPPAPAVAEPAATTAVSTFTAQPSTDPMATLAATLPADPPETCKVTGDALRGEARKRVDSGDDRRMRKDALGALQEYRAALTMDVCNAYAWNGIGDIANDAARPDLAVRALRNTTRLLPGHYGAWTMLGKNYEALRQMKLAAEAYTKALELRPGLPEALDGWRRTAAP
jgi:hypothetical protein